MKILIEDGEVRIESPEDEEKVEIVRLRNLPLCGQCGKGVLITKGEKWVRKIHFEVTGGQIEKVTLPEYVPLEKEEVFQKIKEALKINNEIDRQGELNKIVEEVLQD